MMVFNRVRFLIQQVDRTARDLGPYLLGIVGTTLFAFGCLDFALLKIDQNQELDGIKLEAITLSQRLMALVELALGIGNPSAA